MPSYGTPYFNVAAEDPVYGGLPQYGSGQPLTNYQNVLQNDPAYQQFLADLGAQNVSDEASARAAVSRGLVRFGEVPQGVQSQFGTLVDPTTAALAQKNTESGMSIVARLNKVRQDNLRMIKAQLAARGGLNSGELPYQLGEEQTRYGQAYYDASEQLMDYVLGINAGLAAAKRQRAQQQAEAAQRAAANSQSTPGSGDSTPPPAGPPAANEYDDPWLDQWNKAWLAQQEAERRRQQQPPNFNWVGSPGAVLG